MELGSRELWVAQKHFFGLYLHHDVTRLCPGPVRRRVGFYRLDYIHTYHVLYIAKLRVLHFERKNTVHLAKGYLRKPKYSCETPSRYICLLCSSNRQRSKLPLVDYMYFSTLRKVQSRYRRELSEAKPLRDFTIHAYPPRIRASSGLSEH